MKKILIPFAVALACFITVWAILKGSIMHTEFGNGGGMLPPGAVVQWSAIFSMIAFALSAVLTAAKR